MAQDKGKTSHEKGKEEAAEARVAITPPPAVLLSAERHERQQLAAEMAELRKNPLDRATQPGGVYGNAGGDGWHDAEGRELNEDGSVKKQKRQPDE